MRNQPTPKAGFSLVEVLMAMAISTFVLASAYATIISLAKGSESMINYTEMNSQTRVALEMFGRDARMAHNVETANSTSIMFERKIKGITYDIYYAYVPSAGTFSKTIFVNDNETDPKKKTVSSRPDATRTYLYDVDALVFNYYTFRQVATTNATEIKHVQIEGVLERRVLNVFNTNYIISARFMMRNKDVSN